MERSDLCDTESLVQISHIELMISITSLLLFLCYSSLIMYKIKATLYACCIEFYYVQGSLQNNFHTIDWGFVSDYPILGYRLRLQVIKKIEFQIFLNEQKVGLVKVEAWWMPLPKIMAILTPKEC